jgi:hypothetical protein
MRYTVVASWRTHEYAQKKVIPVLSTEARKGPRVLPSTATPGFNPPTKKSSDRDVAELIDILDAIVAEDNQGPATSRDGLSEVLEWLEPDASPSPSRERSICTSVSDAVHS